MNLTLNCHKSVAAWMLHFNIKIHKICFWSRTELTVLPIPKLDYRGGSEGMERKRRMEERGGKGKEKERNNAPI